MIPETPAEWLDLLSARLDARSVIIDTQRQYLTGNAPMPEGATTHREAYQRFQASSRTNLAELVVDALVDRMVIAGFSVDGDGTDNDAARVIWRRSRMDAGSADVHRDMAGVGIAYAMVYRTRTNEVRISPEPPEFVITDVDPTDPDEVRAGLKVWRDPTEGIDVAMVHTPGVVTRFERTADAPTYTMRNADGTFPPFVYGASAANFQRPPRWSGAWTEVSVNPTGLAQVPIVQLVNRGGLGEFATHTDLLDRINWTILQRLIITAMQAFRQRAIKGDLPEKDTEGNVIDYDAMFVPGADALWTLPDGVDLWESQQTDTQVILSAGKDDIQQLAALTRTPMSTFMPGGENQTAEGAAFAREGLVFKAEDRIARATASWDALMTMALELDGQPGARVETIWTPAERTSLAERADAATKATDLPWRARMQHIWGFSGDEIDAMEAEKDAETPPPTLPVFDRQASLRNDVTITPTPETGDNTDA